MKMMSLAGKEEEGAQHPHITSKKPRSPILKWIPSLLLYYFSCYNYTTAPQEVSLKQEESPHSGDIVGFQGKWITMGSFLSQDHKIQFMDCIALPPQNTFKWYLTHYPYWSEEFGKVSI